MVSGPSYHGGTAAPAIHRGASGAAAPPALCGSHGTPSPRTHEWRYVTCPTCLDLAAPGTPAAASRLRELRDAGRLRT